MAEETDKKKPEKTADSRIALEEKSVIDPKSQITLLSALGTIFGVALVAFLIWRFSHEHGSAVNSGPNRSYVSRPVAEVETIQPVACQEVVYLNGTNWSKDLRAGRAVGETISIFPMGARIEFFGIRSTGPFTEILQPFGTPYWNPNVNLDSSFLQCRVAAEQTPGLEVRNPQVIIKSTKQVATRVIANR